MQVWHREDTGDLIFSRHYRSRLILITADAFGNLEAILKLGVPYLNKPPVLTHLLLRIQNVLGYLGKLTSDVNQLEPFTYEARLSNPFC